MSANPQSPSQTIEASNPGYTGSYLNLDRCPERKVEIESQLQRLQLSQLYQRFSASDGNTLNLLNPHLTNGEMGCFTSHYLCLKKHVGDQSHLHIIEDDVLFSPYTAPILRNLVQSNRISKYDMVFTDISIPISGEIYRTYKYHFEHSLIKDKKGEITNFRFGLMDLSRAVFAAASSYIVNYKSLAKVTRICEEEITHGPRAAIDLVFRRKIHEGLLSAACVFPFVTSIRLDHTITTSIPGRYDTLAPLASNIARQSFFVGRDWVACREYAAKLTSAIDDDVHASLLGMVLAFSLTDKFQSF